MIFLDYWQNLNDCYFPRDFVVFLRYINLHVKGKT